MKNYLEFHIIKLSVASITNPVFLLASSGKNAFALGSFVADAPASSPAVVPTFSQCKLGITKLACVRVHPSFLLSLHVKEFWQPTGVVYYFYLF